MRLIIFAIILFKNNLFVCPMLLFFLSLFLCRQIEIQGSSVFEFGDFVTPGNIYKFKYSSPEDVEIALYDPMDRFIYSEVSRAGNLFTKTTTSGKIKIKVKNLSKESMVFSYKCPDPNKEIIGHLGYIKDADAVSDLVKMLDKFTEDQLKQLKRTKEHYELVKKSRKWSRALIMFEIILSTVGIYFIHKDFVKMFESKENL